MASVNHSPARNKKTTTALYAARITQSYSLDCTIVSLANLRTDYYYIRYRNENPMHAVDNIPPLK